MAPWLKALAILSKDLCSIHNAHRATLTTVSNSSPRVSLLPCSVLLGSCTYAVHLHIGRTNVITPEIKTNKSLKTKPLRPVEKTLAGSPYLVPSRVLWTSQRVGFAGAQLRQSQELLRLLS